jgi:UPF0716 protein FxsA
VLLIPPVRKLIGQRAEASAARRLSPAAVGDLFGPRRVRVRRGETIREPVVDPGPQTPPPPAGPAIEGEIVD